MGVRMLYRIYLAVALAWLVLSVCILLKDETSAWASCTNAECFESSCIWATGPDFCNETDFTSAWNGYSTTGGGVLTEHASEDCRTRTGPGCEKECPDQSTPVVKASKCGVKGSWGPWGPPSRKNYCKPST
jgi:hypothetical protein